MEKQIKIALAGNPNCGKTTLFNALTGSNQFVGNWPGVTVEKKEGRLKKHDDVVIMDMEAGPEHPGRGTASMMDQFIVVIEPRARSVQTYVRIKELARDIGITKVRVVANKIRDESDREFIRSRIPADDLLGFISYSPTVIDADRKGLSPYDCSPDALDEIRANKAAIDAKE